MANDHTMHRELGVLEGRQSSLTEHVTKMETRFDQRLDKLENQLNIGLAEIHRKFDANCHQIMAAVHAGALQQASVKGEAVGKTKALAAVAAASSGSTGIIAYVAYLLLGGDPSVPPPPGP